MIMRELKAFGYATLVVGGFLILTYFAFAYFAVWRHEFLPVFPENPRFEPFSGNDSGAINLTASAGFSPRRRPVEEPLSQIFSPQALGLLLVGLLLSANGYFLLRFLRQKEVGDTKKFVISSLLTPEEKAVFDQLVASAGQSTQKQLALSTGFSPVKTYRLLKRLEGKKILKSYPYGMTNKIVLVES